MTLLKGQDHHTSIWQYGTLTSLEDTSAPPSDNIHNQWSLVFEPCG